jgi:hypothetical protein
MAFPKSNDDPNYALARVYALILQAARERKAKAKITAAIPLKDARPSSDLPTNNNNRENEDEHPSPA